MELGIRPEHIDVVNPGDGHVTATAVLVEHLVSDTNIYVTIEGLGQLMVRKHGNISAKSGDQFGLRVQPDNAHLFAHDGSALKRTQTCT